jgi:hypothetical protein
VPGAAGVILTPAELATLRIVPVTHAKANDFVRQHHRHHKPTPGCLFCVGVEDHEEQLRGVAIVALPVARMLMDGRTAEIRRVATDGARNACSMLLAASRKAARAMGYQRIITYTLPSEGGASLRAAGFVFDGEAGGSSLQWAKRNGTTLAPALDGDLVNGKWRWVA